MGIILYLDTVLIPISVFLIVGYHANLWHNFKNKPSHTSIGIEALANKVWFLSIKEGDDKKGMLVVQSLRNSLMVTILTASLAILVNLALAALINNSYNASHMLESNPIFGSQTGRMFAVKYGSASVLLLVSFFCSSMGLGFLTDANFLINATPRDFSSSADYTHSMYERGCMLAFVGSRVLCMAFPLLLWMFGPLPVLMSSLALLRVLYEIDFVAK